MNTTLHFMLDLETMATKNDAAIVAIGAVRFTPHAGTIGETFYRNVRLGLQSDREIDPSTVEWWLGQDKTAQDALLAEPRVSLYEALKDFRSWLWGFVTDPVVLRRHGRLWSNGPTFDEVIIRHAFENHLSESFPIGYFGSRCMRTITEMAKAMGLKKPERDGTHHNALDDARYQAEGVISVFNDLLGGRNL